MILNLQRNLLLLILFLGITQLQLQAQQQEVTGTVTSAVDQTFLPSVSVTVQGQAKGVLTDFDGNYSIRVSPEDVLVFSYIGFETFTATVGNQTEINVVLNQSIDALDEVVVTGYDTSTKRTFTGASSSIKARDLKVDGVVDVSRMLEGRAAGINIQNVTGTFGAAPKITIRGASSIFGDTRPLWVIDGVIQEDLINVDFNGLTSGDASTLISSAIAGLNANDIKTVDILKDASATALYGARALNGVVVITTKRGRRNAPLVVNYTMEQTIRDIPSYANYDILDSKESVGVFKELEAKGFLELPNVAQNRFGGIYSILARETNRFDESTGTFGAVNTVEGRNRFLQQYEQANTDWYKELFRQSVTQNHTLSFTGGGDNSSFFASLGYYHDPGWTIADEVNRLTTNIKNTFYFSDKFNLTLSTLSSIRQQDAPGTFNQQVDNFRGDISRVFDINPFGYAFNTSRTLRPRDSDGNLEYYTYNWTPFNILDELDNNFIELDVKDIRFQIDANYKFLENLSYDFVGSVRYVDSRREHNITEDSNTANAYRSEETTIIRDANIFLFTDPDNPLAPPVSVLPQGGIFVKTNNSLVNYYIRNSFNYQNIFNNKHDLSVLLGQEMRFIDRKQDFFTGYGLQYNRGFVPFTDPDIFTKTLGDRNDYFGLEEERERTIGLFGKTTYGFDNRYIFSLTGRYDGSNRQGRSRESRWLPTASVSGKWAVSEEKFMENVDFVNNFAFRASYGLTATAGPATNSLPIFFSSINDRILFEDRERVLDIIDLQNTELTWEKQYETNIGVDMGFLKNRIQITADIFERKGFDLIDFVRTSGIGGEFFKQGNNADLETRGLEVSLTTTPIKTENFSWSATVNMTLLEQEITELKNTPNVFDLVDPTGGNVVGFPRQSLFSFDFIGLDDRGLAQFRLPEDPGNPENSINGANFQDIDNILDYLVYEGPVEPTRTGGFASTFTYKDWSLSFLISASGGNKIRLNPSYSVVYSDLSSFNQEIVNRWLVPGDERFTQIPVIADRRLINEVPNLFRSYNAYNYSDIRIADGDFVRMKNISLSYNFPEDLIERIGFSTFNMRLATTNPFLIYSDSRLNGQDPEFFNSGGVAYPIIRQFTLSLNIGI